jgi:RimJ/RimL family protein N-acetyltransferase
MRKSRVRRRQFDPFIWRMRPEPIAGDEIPTVTVGVHGPRSRSELAPSPHRRPVRNEPITVLDRPLIDAEWDKVRAFVRRMDNDDLRLRFGNPRDLRDEATMRQAFDIEGGLGEIAWILDEAAAIAGIAHRIMVSRAEAEIGLIVRSDLKRGGYGEYLLRDMLARSARQGLTALIGLVLQENHAMRRLAAKIGCVLRKQCASTIELAFEIGTQTDIE